MTGTDVSVRSQSGIDALPSSANAQGWTPQQRNLMLFAGVAKTVTREGKSVVIVPDPGFAEAFLMVCQRTGLDPFAKQIYAMEAGGKTSIVVGVDGFRVVAQRSKGYRGQIGPQWTRDGVNWVDAWLPAAQGGQLGEKPAAARIGILREGFDQPLWQVVTWAEFGMEPRFKGDNWGTRPAHMLGIRAETHGLRRTFPNDLSGLYTPEDFDDVDSVDSTVVDVKAMIETVQSIRDLEELGRQFQEWNAIGMPEDVRKAFMAHGGVLKAEADAEERRSGPPHDEQTGELHDDVAEAVQAREEAADAGPTQVEVDGVVVAETRHVDAAEVSVAAADAQERAEWAAARAQAPDTADDGLSAEERFDREEAAKEEAWLAEQQAKKAAAAAKPPFNPSALG